MGGRLSSPDLKNGARQWILAFQIFQNAIRKRLWKYRKTGIFFIFHNSPMQQQHLCGTKTNQKCIRLFLLSVIRRCDADDSLVFFFKHTSRNESIISKSSTFAVSCATEWNLFRQCHIVWKLLKMSHLNFWILTFSTDFSPIKTDLSGNTIWPQASGFQKLAIYKM